MIDLVLRWLTYAYSIAPADCSQQLHVFIYLTPIKKEIPNFEVIDRNYAIHSNLAQRQHWHMTFLTAYQRRAITAHLKAHGSGVHAKVTTACRSSRRLAFNASSMVLNPVTPPHLQLPGLAKSLPRHIRSAPAAAPPSPNEIAVNLFVRCVVQGCSSAIVTLGPINGRLVQNPISIL